MRIGLERIAATGLVGAMAATGLLSAGGVASAEPGGIARRQWKEREAVREKPQLIGDKIHEDHALP